MRNLLPFIIIGVTSGSVYGLAGVGLVLTYKTSGIFNFAHGALATVAAFVFYALHVQHRVPWPLAATISVLILGVAMGLAMEGLARRLTRVALALRIAATVGILLVVVAVCTILYGSVAKAYPSYLPTSTFRLGGVNVGWNQLTITLVSLVATASLYVFFRTARTGKAMRAVVDDPDLLALSGTSPVTVRRWAWIIGCFFAALSGLLLAPSINLDPLGLTILVVQAFGAAAIGGFANLPMTWVGGVLIGVADSVSTKYISSTSILGGLPPSLPFIVLFVVLLVYPRARLAARQAALIRPPIQWRAPARVQLPLAVVVVAFLVAVPTFAGFHTSDWTTSLTYVIILLSLGLLVRTSGQVSLAHVTFAAVGAVAFSKLAGGPHLPWLVALILAGLIAVPIGAVLAIPAIRLAGLYLALATFGFGLLVQNMFYQSSVMFGTTNLGLPMPMPHLSWVRVDTDAGYYYVVLAITLVVATVVVVLVRSRLGRLLRAMADSPTALATGGTNVNVTRVLVFCLSAYLAAISGALLGVALSTASGASFNPFGSLSYLALVLIVSGGEPWYAMIGGLGLGLVPTYLSSTNTSNWLSVVFGVSAVVVALGYSAHLPAAARLRLDRLGARRGAPPAGPPTTAGAPPIRRVTASALAVEDLTVRFGGLVAVDGLSLVARTGHVTGLIGPNGSGKTTTFNACSALNRPNRGRILIGGKDVSHLGPAARARRGLGRTFQLMELYDSLTVADNVALGREAALAGGRVAGQILARRHERAETRRAADEALALCQLTDVAHVQVAALSTGQRRVVELARCLAGRADILLLDEPSSGLDRTETEHFAGIIRRVVDERGVGILLVEHDMGLVLDVCDDIYVLDFGTLLFHGTPEEVRTSPTVLAAYLGTAVTGTAVAS